MVFWSVKTTVFQPKGPQQCGPPAIPWANFFPSAIVVSLSFPVPSQGFSLWFDTCSHFHNCVGLLISPILSTLVLKKTRKHKKTKPWETIRSTQLSAFEKRIDKEIRHNSFQSLDFGLNFSFGFVSPSSQAWQMDVSSNTRQQFLKPVVYVLKTEPTIERRTSTKSPNMKIGWCIEFFNWLVHST